MDAEPCHRAFRCKSVVKLQNSKPAPPNGPASCLLPFSNQITRRLFRGVPLALAGLATTEAAKKVLQACNKRPKQVSLNETSAKHLTHLLGATLLTAKLLLDKLFERFYLQKWFQLSSGFEQD